MTAKKIVLDRKCPKCDGKVEERDGKYGKFWGCISYPACRGVWNPPSDTDTPAEERKVKTLTTPYGDIKFQ